MGLLEIPPELRLKIYENLSDFSTSGRIETIGRNVRLSPRLCKVNRLLRQEALPLFAKTSAFIIQTDEDLHAPENRVNVWLRALGDDALSKVQSLQLSRHWKIGQPSRWSGHIGFYVRVILHDRTWQCSVGTYPFANDQRGMRLESVDLLCSVVQRRLALLSESGDPGLSRADVEFIVEAMDVVASRPISTFDIEQSDLGRRRRREVWSNMEKDLLAVSDQHRVDRQTTRPFYTPY